MVTVEAAITQRLRADTTITQYVSTFNGSPAIFSDIAPQQAERPYVVFDVQNTNDSVNNLGVNAFVIDVDIYAGRNDHSKIRALGQRIIFSLDRTILKCDNYTTIRLYFESEGHVENQDIKITHYNMQFYARGCRYAWMQQL